MISLLDIIGPVMVGPSSSHTAGACRIALLARALVGGTPDDALIELHGSFAKTGVGHGTDRALVGGLLGFLPDDERLRDSLELAAHQGMQARFAHVRLGASAHPNTARLTLRRGAQTVVVTGSSLGGGRVQLTEIDGLAVEISGEYPTLVVVAHDQPGAIAAVADVLADCGVNVATVRLSRHRKGGDAIHVYELDEPVSAEGLVALRAVPTVRFLRPLARVC